MEGCSKETEQPDTNKAERKRHRRFGGFARNVETPQGVASDVYLGAQISGILFTCSHPMLRT